MEDTFEVDISDEAYELLRQEAERRGNITVDALVEELILQHLGPKPE